METCANINPCISVDISVIGVSCVFSYAKSILMHTFASNFLLLSSWKKFGILTLGILILVSDSDNSSTSC